MNRLVCVHDYEKEAKLRLPRTAYEFITCGATTEQSLRRNETSMQKWYIRPRFLRDVSVRSMSTSILGHKISVPFGMSPTALQRLCCDEGECASVKATSRMNTVYTLSTASTVSLEKVASVAPAGLKFFQLNIYKDRNLTVELVRRAEKAGFKAIVLTIDAPCIGIRYADIRNPLELPSHLTFANFERGDDPAPSRTTSGDGSYVNRIYNLFDKSVTWKDVAWLRGLTSLPIVIKGVLTREDAELSIEAGAAAIWVSNHGARQVDGFPPTMEVLPGIVDAVGGRCEVYVDGGFRTGSDIFKALGLGADVVFLGRPFVWGLACEGENGVYNIIDILKKELDSVMALSGCATLKDISRKMVIEASCVSKY